MEIIILALVLATLGVSAATLGVVMALYARQD